MLQGQNGLQHPGQARSRLQMTDIGLDRADRERRGPLPSERTPDRIRFDRVADRRAGSVGLDERQGVGRDAGLGVDRLEQCRLRFGRRQRQADGPPVRVGAARGEQCPHPAAGVAGAIGGLQHHGDTAFGTDIAVGARVERVAAPGGREHGSAGEADEGERAEQEIDARHDRRVHPSGADGLRRLVQGQ